jgi:hypothetical protein
LKRALVILTLAACSHEPRVEDRAPARPAVALPAVVTPPPPRELDASQIEWQGDPAFPTPESQAKMLVRPGSNVLFVPKERSAHVLRRTATNPMVTIWDHQLPDEFVSDAAMLVDGDTLYLVYYSAISSGATVHALDFETGTERWATPVHGLGPIGHSKYANHVVVRMIQGLLVVFGNEAAGRYIEVFDPVSGKMKSTAIEPRPKP